MGFKQWAGIALAVVCAGSIGLRALMSSPEPFDPATVSRESTATGSQSPGTPGVGRGIVSPLVGGDPARSNPPSDPSPPRGEAPGADGERSGFEDALPMVTEASFFGLLGFALGYASKKILKLAMIFLAIHFAIMQFLVFVDVATLDWDRAVQLLNDAILNLKQDRSLTEVLTARIPAAATLLGGFFVGFRRG